MTPMQQIFYRIEQLRFANNPIDELMMIRLQMLEKEKEEMCEFAVKCMDGIEYGLLQSEVKTYYNETFNTKEK